MPFKCQTAINIIERFAPKSLAEEWDNVGLQVGDPGQETTGVLVTLDVTSSVIAEAEALGANLVVSHHPMIFKPLKHIRADLPSGRLVTELIKKGIAVYCAHTNLDSAREGVNKVLADLFSLKDIEVLTPDKVEKFFKIAVFIPRTHIDSVREAMTGAGAGHIGNYSDCTFMVEGTGTFKASEGCSPFLGQPGVLEKAQEVRLETIVREKQVDRVIRAMIKAHPYEEVAYDLYSLANQGERLGLGRVGRLEKPVTLREFLDTVKSVLKVDTLRYGGEPDSIIKKVAVCGGSGAGSIPKASFAGADVLLTGDIKYHEAQEALNLGLSFVDAGHYATENPVTERLVKYLETAFASEGIFVPIHAASTTADTFKYY